MTVTTAATIQVRVLCFAQLRAKLGSEHLLALPAGATGQAVQAWAQQQAPLLQPLLAVTRLAVNCAYAPWETRLADGDEVALIPPVSGG